MPRQFIIVLRQYPTQPVELMLGVIAFFWGLWLLMPWDAMSVSSQADMLLRFAAEWKWGALMSAIGIYQLYAMRIGLYCVKRRAAMLALLWFTWLDCAYAAGNWHGSSTPILSTYAAFETWIFLRTL